MYAVFNALNFQKVTRLTLTTIVLFIVSKSMAQSPEKIFKYITKANISKAEKELEKCEQTSGFDNVQKHLICIAGCLIHSNSNSVAYNPYGALDSFNTCDSRLVNTSMNSEVNVFLSDFGLSTSAIRDSIFTGIRVYALKENTESGYQKAINVCKTCFYRDEFYKLKEKSAYLECKAKENKSEYQRFVKDYYSSPYRLEIQDLYEKCDTFPNGQKKIKGDKIEGEYIEFSENGKVATKGYYSGIKKTGEWIFFSSNGELTKRCNYSNDKLEGLFEEYIDGRLKERYNLKDGKKNGRYESFYSNGRVREEITYKDDKPNGSYIKYFNNGNPSEIIQYDNGLLKDNLIRYYESGEVKEVKGHWIGPVNEELGMYSLKMVELTQEEIDIYTYLDKCVKSCNKGLVSTRNYIQLAASFTPVGYSAVTSEKVVGDFESQMYTTIDIPFGHIVRVLKSEITPQFSSICVTFVRGFSPHFRWSRVTSENNQIFSNDILRHLSIGGFKMRADVESAELHFTVSVYDVASCIQKILRLNEIARERNSAQAIDRNKPTPKRIEKYDGPCPVPVKIQNYDWPYLHTYYEDARGILNGPYEIKNKNGKIIIRGQFKDNVEVGIWTIGYESEDYGDGRIFRDCGGWQCHCSGYR
jgi:antitoxin component YwqK of YwqJK toxin-antitoxin module